MINRPKLSIGSWAFAFGPFEREPWSFTKVLQYAAEAGYNGVEVNGFAPHPTPDIYDTPKKRQALAAEIHSFGLGVSAYAPDFRLVPPAISKVSDYSELFKGYTSFACELGTKIIRVDSISPPELLDPHDYEERFKRLVECWQTVAVIAKEVDLRIVWEFEPGFWLNKPQEVLRLVRAVDHLAFQVLFDTSHAYMSGVVGARQTGVKEILSGGIHDYASLLDGYIGHFHLIDSDGTLHDNETSTHAAFGAGNIDFVSFLKEKGQLLIQLDWWCVDFCFNAESEAWGRQAVPFIQRTIREAGL